MMAVPNPPLQRTALRAAAERPSRWAPFMKWIALGIAVAQVAAAMAGPPSPVTPDIRAGVESWPGQAGSRDLRELPAGVATLCADSNGRFAAPGAKWEPTDYIQDAKLPRARLIWSTRSGDRVLVHFEQG